MTDQKLELLDRIVADLRAGLLPEYAVEEYDALATFFHNSDGSVKIRLTQGQFALIDGDDFDRVSAHKWFAVTDSEINDERIFYARAKIRGKSISLHRFILNENHPQKIVDHINHDTLDCRKINLRSVDRFQSAQNRRVRFRKNPAKYVSRFKGVYASVSRTGKLTGWKSSIRSNNRRLYLGIFKTEEEAATAYNSAAIKLHGEHACINTL